MVASMAKALRDALIPLSEGAREAGTSYEVFRRAIARLGAGQRDADGRVLVSQKLVQRLKAERQRSGYLHRRGAKLSDLIKASKCRNRAMPKLTMPKDKRPSIA
jgi:hypothetical protein